MQKELSLLKTTLLLIKDWDGFQKAMREIQAAASWPKRTGQEVCG